VFDASDALGPMIALGTVSDGIYTFTVKPGATDFRVPFRCSGASGPMTSYIAVWQCDTRKFSILRFSGGAFQGVPYQTNAGEMPVPVASVGLQMAMGNFNFFVDGVPYGTFSDTSIIADGWIGVGAASGTITGITYQTAAQFQAAQAAADYAAAQAKISTPTAAGVYGEAAPADNLARGIYGPAAAGISGYVNAARPSASYFVRGMSGVTRMTLTGTDAAKYNISPGNVIYGNTSISTGTQHSFNVVFDNSLSGGTDTLTLPVVFSLADQNVVAFYTGGRYFVDGQETDQTIGDGYINDTTAQGLPDITSAGADAALFSFGYYGSIRTTAAANPYSSHYGAHTVHFTTGGKSTEDLTIYILGPQSPRAKVVFPKQVYDTAFEGAALFNVVASSELGSFSYGILGDAAKYINMDTKGNGVLKAGASLSGKAGTTIQGIVSVTSHGVKTYLSLSVAVAAGNLVAAGSAGSIKLTIPTNLTNNPMSVVVGTPTASGVPGTKIWTMFNQDHYTGDFGEDFRQLTCDPATGTVSFYQQAAARADGHTIRLSCTDGPNTAVETFVIPVTFFVGPTVYVGPGDATSHPGYDHYYSKLTPMLSLIGSDYTLPDPAYAGAVIDLDDGGNDNYFVNDYGTPGFNRAMIHGPLRIRGIAGPNGRRTRLGGPTDGYNGGFNEGQDKAFTLTNGGDIIFENIRWSHCIGNFTPSDTSGGRTALRVNGVTNGDVTVINCQFDNNSNGFETGGGPNRFTIKNSVFFNNGGATQGAGQTHAAYISGSEIIYQRNLSYNNNVGHCLKTRCLRGTIQDSTLADGSTGSASSQINIPQMGEYLIERNTLHKGPSHQNSAVIGYGEDDYGRDRNDLLRLNNNTFFITTVAGVHNGDGQGIRAWCRLSALTGAKSNIIADGNKWFFSSKPPQFKIEAFNATGTDSYNTWTETNSADIVVPPALNLADPGGANPPAENPGRYNYLFYYGGGDYVNMDGVQMISTVKDIRVPANAAPGTVLTNLTAYGADLYKADNIANDIRVNPFVAGSTWQITQDQEFFQGAVWAPVGRYFVVPNGDGTAATLQVAGALAGNVVDFVKVRVTAPNGTKVDWRLPISVIA